MKYIFFIGLIFFIFAGSASACSIVVGDDDNYPVVEKTSILIRTSSAGISTTFNREKYIKVYQRLGDSCGPYTTYIRKDFTFASLAVIALAVYFLLKRKRVFKS